MGVCDENCLGKTYRQGKICFSVSESFFGGELIPIYKAITIMKNCKNFNAVGKNIIQALLKLKLIHPEAVIEIEDTPNTISLL